MYPNYNNFNPYMQQQMYKPVEQPIQQQIVPQTPNFMQQHALLNGKQVESIDVVKAMDIPIDGSVSYYPIADGSAIVTKQIQSDGTSKTIIYKPINEEQKNLPKYVTIEDLDKAIKEIDLSDIEDLKDKISDLKEEIKELKKKKKDE